MQDLDADTLDRTARRRAGMKMGWIVHATVYAAVNLLLVAVAASAGRNWAIFPLLGWGIGLAAHGLAVFLASGGGGLYDRLLQRERDRIGQRGQSTFAPRSGLTPGGSQQRDPW